jgi:hypothetical protein
MAAQDARNKAEPKDHLDDHANKINTVIKNIPDSSEKISGKEDRK